MLVAAIAFDMRAVFSRVALLHHTTVSARFKVRPNKHFDDRRRRICGSSDPWGILWLAQNLFGTMCMDHMLVNEKRVWKIRVPWGREGKKGREVTT